MSEDPTPSSSSQPLVLQIQQSLDYCAKAVEAGDVQQSEALISVLVEFLSSISVFALSNPDDQETQNNSLSLLSHIHSYLSNPSLDQGVIDALSFELPKAVATFTGISESCSEIVESIIDLFISKCNPRDMISVFCEALDSYGKTTDAPGYVTSLIHGVSKAFQSVQRRPFEQMKVALPILLTALKAASFDLDDDEAHLKILLEEAISLAYSMQATCKKLGGEANEKLRALLGLYVLQIMVLSSISLGNNMSTCLPFVQRLSSLLLYCGLSYADLVTDQGVDPLISLVCGKDGEDYVDCFSYVKHGAILSVIWGQVSDEVTLAAGQDLSVLKDDLRSNRSKRWSALGMMKFVFYLGDLPWILKEHALDFLLIITENVSQQETSEDLICSTHTPSLISTLQSILSVIMSSPSASLRKTAFAAMKRMLADIPASLRLDIMLVLVTTSSSSSMTAILLDCVRENLRNDYVKLKEANIRSRKSFWDTGIIDLVEYVLRPPNGGPPSLPEQSDVVLSALNLYRYVLIAESTGKTNYTGVLSKSNLQKAYNEWLLPLRTIVTGINAEIKNDSEQLSLDIMCGLNPVEFVLHRCIELLEENMKQVL